MKTHFAAAAVLLAALAIATPSAHAQVAEAAGVVAPIVVHTLTAAKKKTATSGNWMKAEIIHADANSMMVSEQGNERVIHTFTYGDSLKTKMRKVTDSGGYQFGDKVKVLIAPGNAVALKIHGKPSKAS